VRSAAHNALAGFLSQIDCLPVEAFHQRLQVGSIIGVLLAQLSRDREKFNRVTAVEWLAHFIQLGQVRLAPWYSDLVGALLSCLSDSESELVRTVAKANTALMGLVRATPRAVLLGEEGGSSSTSTTSSSSSSAPAPASILSGVLHSVCDNSGAPVKLVRSASLRWLAMLLQQLPEAVSAQRDSIVSTLLSNLVDTADVEVLKLNLEVLARLSSIDASWGFLKGRVLVDLVRLFGEQRGLLESKAAFIIRRLCLLLDPTVVYLGLSEILAKEANMEFAALCVELLNLILLTSAELSDFRDSLRGCCDVVSAAGSSGSGSGSGSSSGSGAGAGSKEVGVFLSLFRCWVCNPVATVSLCLLVHAYELSSRLVVRVIDMQVTVGLLMQVDKLVQLLESPVFLDVRMALLTPRRPACAELMTTLYGLLMILPQGTAYATLKDRLSAVSSLHYSQGIAHGGGQGSGAAAAAAAPSIAGLDVAAAEATFAASQHLFREGLSAEIRARSILGGGAVAAQQAEAVGGGEGEE
jgi:vacuole morphology and inheritance protein 14